MSEPTLWVEVTFREARAMANVSNLMADVFTGVVVEHAPGYVPDEVPPLVSGAMKMETALMVAGAEL